ncbi:MAG: hypothetical protein IBV52_08370 [Candidatus Bathyarchaeota archaeon]
MVNDAKRFEKLMHVLKSIETKLDTLITLQKAVTPKPSVGKEETKILKLCDKKHTIDDIVQETGKTRSNVESILTILRKKALIRSTKSTDKKTVYKRI